jgi:hypothetical protein
MQPVASAVVASPASAAGLRAAQFRSLVRAPQRLRRQPDSLPDAYWPGQFLHAFTLRMAAHGHCVSASMMLGDGAYATAQLAHARMIEDETLQGLTAQLAEYFSTPLAGMRMSFCDVGGHRHDGALA